MKAMMPKSMPAKMSPKGPMPMKTTPEMKAMMDKMKGSPMPMNDHKK